MNEIIQAVVHDRQIVVPVSDDVPDGTKVEIRITTDQGNTSMDESDWDDSPEGIEAWIQAVRQLEPLIFTEEEKAVIEADRQARKQWEKDHFFERADRLARQWE